MQRLGYSYLLFVFQYHLWIYVITLFFFFQCVLLYGL